MSVEIDVLVADDEAADLIVVGGDRVGLPRARIGAGQAAGGKEEVPKTVHDGIAAGGLQTIKRDSLVDRLDVGRGASRAIGIGRHITPRSG